MISFLETRVESDLRRESNREIAELNAEVEKVRSENHKLSLLLSRRSVGDISELEKRMKPFAGTKFVFDVHALTAGIDAEAYNVYIPLHSALTAAGWIEARQVNRRLNLGPGVVTVTIVSDDVRAPSCEPAQELMEWLHAQPHFGIRNAREDGRNARTRYSLDTYRPCTANS